MYCMSLNGNETWNLVFLPTEKKVIGTKWAYEIKTDSKRNPNRYKVRLAKAICKMLTSKNKRGNCRAMPIRKGRTSMYNIRPNITLMIWSLPVKTKSSY